jgi:hypothetical protein
MTAGDIDKEENLIVEYFTIEASKDLELGEIVVNTGTGIVQARANSTDMGPWFMSMEARDYSDDALKTGERAADHIAGVVVEGYCDVQAYPTAALVQGRYVEMSTTAGEVTIFDYSSPGNWWDVVGIGCEAVASTTTTTDCWVLLGVYP